MRCAVVADIHSNLEAFQAVLADLGARGGADEVWCLGDNVGYGPDPHECLRLLRGLPGVGVAGNHDLAAIGRLEDGRLREVRVCIGRDMNFTACPEIDRRACRRDRLVMPPVRPGRT